MPRMRTIKQAVEYLKIKDPDSAVSEWWLRQMLKCGKIKHHMAGNKYLIDIDYLEKFLTNPPEEEVADFKIGKLRKVY